MLEHEELSPGQAGKLRGKLMFGASQLWGKVGRAFLRALGARKDLFLAAIASIILLALQVRSLVMHGPPLPIPRSGPQKSDVVIFTDGSAPSSAQRTRLLR